MLTYAVSTCEVTFSGEGASWTGTIESTVLPVGEEDSDTGEFVRFIKVAEGYEQQDNTAGSLTSIDYVRCD